MNQIPFTLHSPAADNSPVAGALHTGPGEEDSLADCHCSRRIPVVRTAARRTGCTEEARRSIHLQT